MRRIKTGKQKNESFSGAAEVTLFVVQPRTSKTTDDSRKIKMKNKCQGNSKCIKGLFHFSIYA
jgi:hypothetical protein